MAHRKYYNQDGIEIPSVTTIVKLLEKPGLENWANWMGLVRRINTQTYLLEKSEYGTYCHDLFEQYFMGMITPGYFNPSYVSRVQYEDILKKFQYIENSFYKHHIEVLNMELGLDGGKFGGTLDMLAYSPSMNRIFLFDLKTSKSVYNSHLIQTAGYTLLLEEIYQIPVTDVGILLLSRPTGDELIHIIPRRKNKHNEEIFKRLVDIYYLQQGGFQS